MTSRRLKRGLGNLSNPLYLNANLIYSESLNFIEKEGWKDKIKTGGTLTKLNDSGYNLVSSVLTRMEVTQRLNREKSLSIDKARKVYNSILHHHKILEIANTHDHVSLTAAMLEEVMCSNLDLKDALHLSVAKSLDIPLCTHDKKLRGNYSQHDEKKSYYEKVFKPEELIKPKNK